MCQVSPRQEDTVCYRCHDVGHMARDCRGPDRSRECFACGRDGHVKKECELRGRGVQGGSNKVEAPAGGAEIDMET